MNNEHIMWQAVVECDKAYDNKFFYAVKTVGVYCRPSCRSRTPLRKNVCFFGKNEEAERAGFRPCKRCRPDLLSYEPAQRLAEQIKELIDRFFREKKQLSDEMRQLNISANYLSGIFKKQYGLPPTAYINKKRAAEAKKLLAETNIPIIDIAGDIGFESLSAFYTFFRKHTGLTPRGYRSCVRSL